MQKINKKIKGLVIAFKTLSKEALLILHIGLPIIIIFLLAISIKFYINADINPYAAAHLFKLEFEYVAVGAVLVILGALLFDLSSRNGDIKK